MASFTMTKPRHYVAVQELTGILRILPIVGPFETHGAAFKMTAPVRAALKRHGLYNHCNVIVWTGKRRVRCKFDLSLIDPADVIEASKVRRYV